MTAVVSASALTAPCGHVRALKRSVNACGLAIAQLAGKQWSNEDTDQTPIRSDLISTPDGDVLERARPVLGRAKRAWLQTGSLPALTAKQIADVVYLLEFQREARRAGRLLHAAVERWARTRELPVLADLEMQGWLDLLACDWEPPVDGEYEVAWGLRAVDDGRPVYVEVTEPEPHVYAARDGGPLLTAGRADGAWWAVEGLCVIDFKTGKWPAPPAEKNLQVNAAGIALALKRGAKSYRPGIYYARDGFWDWGPRVVFGTPPADRILGEVRDAALLDETPRPGPQCAACWERRACAHATT